MTDRQPSIAGLRCPAGFRRRTITLQPCEDIDFVRPDWADAVVVVERGTLEVECRTGGRATFRTGDVLAFADLPLRRLRNAGATPLVLSALSRRSPVPGRFAT